MQYTTSASQITFTLTLPTDSAFATLTGATTVQVYQQAGTQLHGILTVANGSDVQARGFLFNDACTGQGESRQCSSRMDRGISGCRSLRSQDF